MKKLIFIFLVLVACGEKNFQLSLIHINDTHAKHLPSIRTNKKTQEVQTNGGKAQLSSLIKKLREKEPNVLVLHGGDAVTGSVYSLVYKGEESSDLMNMIGFDVAVPGNHEFDFGLDQAYKMLAMRNFPTVSANVFETDTGLPVTRPYFTTNINGREIAVIGILTKDEVYSEKNGTPGYITIEDEIESIKNLLDTDKELAKKDHLILLSHSGYKKDWEIAEAFPNRFDVIVGGHSHTPLEQPVKVGKTLIVQTDNNIKNLGKLALTYHKNQLISYQYDFMPVKNIEPDKEIVKYLEEKQALVDKEMGEVIGTINGDLTDENIRLGSTQLGNYIADSLLEIYADQNADIVLVNSGSVRAPLLQGDLTMGTLFEFHPFDNTAVYFEVTGADLQEIIEVSATSNYGEGGFLQLSKGTFVTVNPDKTIKEILVKNQPLNPEKNYKILINDWLYGGGDGYTMIPQKAKNVRLIGSDFRDMLIQKIKKDQKIDVNELDRKPRWNFL